MQNYDFKTYTQLFRHILKQHTNATFLNELNDNKYEHLDVNEFGNRVKHLAYALKNTGFGLCTQKYRHSSQ